MHPTPHDEESGRLRVSRLVRWGVVATLTLLAAAVAAVVVAFPSVVATTCPGCFGMEEVEPGIYTGPDATAEQSRTLVGQVAEARARVEEFYGDRQSSPVVLACFDAGCYERIGGGRERGIAVLNRAVMLSPRGLDVGILAHEMSHVELHRRLGGVRAEVPQWFDEGLAVVAGDDRRYIAAAGSADRCLVCPDGPLPVSLDEWLRAASADVEEYAKAACAVSNWLAKYDSPAQAMGHLIDRLGNGASLVSVLR